MPNSGDGNTHVGRKETWWCLSETEGNRGQTEDTKEKKGRGDIRGGQGQLSDV